GSKGARGGRGIFARGWRRRRFEFGKRNAKILARREKKGAFDEVLEFADVAGPGVVRQSVHDVSGDVLDIFVELTAESLHEVANQEGEIFGALAERRDLYGENIQAVVEIAAKGAFGDTF